ncbi:hypothetical protein MUK42_19777 [Musa troglodytarum]|uniref:Uncharacterized protein n=1 Tax=Musa troglodytarum TaxID=320322 RepID=A0A9E7FVN6_9LILI|nr:hypothetical protein MUK42_19777 [Musa troglodytarum]
MISFWITTIVHSWRGSPHSPRPPPTFLPRFKNNRAQSTHVVDANDPSRSLRDLHPPPSSSIAERQPASIDSGKGGPASAEIRMKVDRVDQLEVRPSMESFRFLDSTPASSTARRRLHLELQMVGSLEKKRGDLLLKMVDDLEYNMKQSRSEIQRGRLYEKYAEKREAKLREEWATKGARRREKMKVIESQLEESLARMTARKQDSAIRHGHQEKVKSFEKEDLHEQIQFSQTLLDDGSLRSSGSNAHSTRHQTLGAPIPKHSKRHNPDSARRRAKAVKLSAQSLPDLSYLRKESMNTPTRLSKGSSPSESTACAQSNSTTGFTSELQDPNFALSKSLKEQSQKTITGRANGAGNTCATSITEPRASKAFETESKGDESEVMLNQQINQEPESRKIEERAPIFHLGSDSEETRSSQASEMCDTKSENYGTLRNLGEEDNVLAVASKFSSNLRPSHSCVEVASYSFESARVRKKWGVAEKPNLATNTSEKSLKDVVKQFKKLLTFGKKGKSAESAVKILAHASVAGGDDEMDNHHEAAKIPSDDPKKPRNGYSAPAYVVGLHEGKIFPEQVQSPSCSISTPPANMKLREDQELEGFPKAARSVLSFFSFHGRGSESRFK